MQRFIVPMALRWHGANYLLVALFAAAVLAWPWYRVVQTMRHVTPVKPAVAPTSVVWGNRVFSSPDSLRHWLHFRGASLSVWSLRHPLARRHLG